MAPANQLFRNLGRNGAPLTRQRERRTCVTGPDEGGSSPTLSWHLYKWANTERTWVGENKSFPCLRHLILRLPISVWLPRSAARVGWRARVKKRDCIICPPSFSCVLCYSCQSNGPPLQWLARAWKWKEGNRARRVFASLLPVVKGWGGGRLVSAVSQKVTACVRGDAGCYCLTDKKERRKAFRGDGKCDGTYTNVWRRLARPFRWLLWVFKSYFGRELDSRWNARYVAKVCGLVLINGFGYFSYARHQQVHKTKRAANESSIFVL